MEKLNNLHSRLGLSNALNEEQWTEVWDQLGSNSNIDEIFAENTIWNEIEELSSSDLILIIEQATNAVTSSIQVDSDDSSCLKQLLLFALASMKKFSETNVRLTLARLITRVCGITGSSAHGFTNPFILHSLLSNVQSIIVDEATKASKGKGKSKKSSQQETDGGNNDSDDESSDPFVLSQASVSSRSTRSQYPLSQGQSGSGKPIYKTIAFYLNDIRENISVFSNSSDGSLLESVIEVVVSILFLCEIKSYSEGNIAIEVLILIGKQSKVAMMGIFKSIMTAIIMTGRDLRIPESTTGKTSCHKAAMKLVNTVVKNSSAIAAQWNIEQTTGQEIDSNIELDSPQRAETEASSQASAHLDLPFSGIVGILQRLTLCAPDRMNIRAIASNSIFQVVATIYEGMNGKLHNATDSLEAKSLFQYFNFLLKLSCCNKVGLRAFAVEIIATILESEWMWQQATDFENEKAVALPKALLLTLVDRCGDTAPTVRVRAVTSLSNLLESLANDSDENRQPIKCNLFLSLVLGLTGPAHVRLDRIATSNEEIQEKEIDTKLYDLLETLRSRVNDDKPLVRARAVQAFGLALHLKYPKYTKALLSFEQMNVDADMPETPAIQREYVSMFISDDDVNLIIERCDDVSISVRKSAIAALTALVEAKPGDISVLDGWVTAVLPLVTDPEASVQLKVASAVLDLILDNLVGWYRQNAKSRRNPSSNEDNSTAVTNSWQILIKIAEVDQIRLLREAIHVLIKQQAIVYEKNSSKLSIVELLEAAKFASCSTLERNRRDAELFSQGTAERQLSNDSQEYLVDLRNNDPTLTSKAGWIFLEAVVGHEALIHKQVNSLSPDSSDDNASAANETIDGKQIIKKALTNGLKSADFVVRCFTQKRETNSDMLDDEEIRILRVIQMLASQLSDADIQQVRRTLLPLILNLKQTPAATSAGIATLYALSMVPHMKAMNRSTASSSSAVYHQCCRDVKAWAGELLATCFPVLMGYCWGREISSQFSLSQVQTQCSQTSTQGGAQHCMLDGLPAISLHKFVAHAANHPDAPNAIEACKQAIFVIGEISMLGFSIEEEEVHKFQVAPADSQSSALPAYATADNGGFRVIVPEQIETLVKVLMASNLTRDNNDQVHAGGSAVNLTQITIGETDRVPVCAADVRAFAFVTMGKMCLRNKELAQSMVNVFLRELNPSDGGLSSAESAASSSCSSSSPALRSNALLVLGDLCVRYTQLIDRNVGQMAICLQDESLIVRKHAIVLLTQLLLQDYLKWRGLLLFRFLATAVDENAELAEFARIVLRKTILSKHPDFFCQHFSEAVVVFSGWSDHPSYLAAKFAGSEGDSCVVSMDGVNMHGPSKRSARLRLYQFMMEGLSEEQKIHVTASLVDDLLSHAIDSNAFHSSNYKEDQYNPCEEAVEDVLLVLRSPLLKVGKKSDASQEDEAELELDEATASGQAAVAKAKSIVLKKLSKQHLVSQLLPVVASLKHLLEAAKSPIQGAVMEYLIYVMKNSKSEVDQALSNDPCLRSEIEYDLKQYQKSKEVAATSARMNALMLTASKSASKPGSDRASTTASKSASRASMPLSPANPNITRAGPESTAKLSKPSLRKSVGSEKAATGASMPRTPKQAIAAVGRLSLLNVANEEENNDEDTGYDLANRLTAAHCQSFHRMSEQAEDDPSQLDESFDLGQLQADDENKSIQANANSMKRTNSGKRNASVASLAELSAAPSRSPDSAPAIKRVNSKGKEENQSNADSRGRSVPSANGLVSLLQQK